MAARLPKVWVRLLAKQLLFFEKPTNEDEVDSVEEAVLVEVGEVLVVVEEVLVGAEEEEDEVASRVVVEEAFQVGAADEALVVLLRPPSTELLDSMVLAKEVL